MSLIAQSAFVRDPDHRFDEFGLTYDPNGNIQTLSRNAYQTALGMAEAKLDQLSYHYYPKTNQLSHITDALAHSSETAFGDIVIQPTANYTYDALGCFLSITSAS